MKSFIKKSNDKILNKVWNSLIEFYDRIDEKEIARKEPGVGYTIDVNDKTKVYPNFINTLKKYFNTDAYLQYLSFFEIKDPGWGKHVDSTSSGIMWAGSCIWPIKNCSSEDITKWYEQTKGTVEQIKLNDDQKDNGIMPWVYSDDSMFKLIDSTSINCPTIIRTDIMHEVNSPGKTRVVASWKLGSTEDISWKEICDLYQ